MPESTLDSLPDHLNGRLQNSNPGVVTAAGTREVVRCHRCFLVQFRTTSDRCRRCAKPLLPRPRPEGGKAARPGNSENITTLSVASSTQGEILRDEPQRDDPQLRGKIAMRLALGSKLKELRKSRNLTQEQIAVQAGVPRSYISRIERSHLLPGPAMVRRLAEALGVKMLDLFQNESNGDNDNEDNKDNQDPGSTKNLSWNAFARHFQQLQTEQQARVLYRVRAMLCERLHQQYCTRRRRPMPARRFSLRRALTA